MNHFKVVVPSLVYKTTFHHRHATCCAVVRFVRGTNEHRMAAAMICDGPI